MKKTILGLMMLVCLYSNGQCNLTFNELVTTLRSDEINIKNLLSERGYKFDYNESTYFCGNEKSGYLFSKKYQDGVIVIDYMMPNSSYENQKIFNNAKSYGMRLTDSKINPTLGVPINIYTGGAKNLMMQISSTDSYTSITIYEKL